MIDESKYEGHTEGKWEYNSATILATAKGGNEIIAEYPCWNYNKDQLITKEEETNLRLMADAPLLLAEVKRLRVIEEQRRRMGNVLADYCIEDVCDEFFEGDYSFYERLVKAYRWKEGDEE